MYELAKPFIRAWDWVERVGGFPGQVFAVVLVIMVIVGGLTWYSNRK
jgi:hypothetical protein